METNALFWTDTQEFLDGDGFRDLPKYLFVERKEIQGFPNYMIYQDGRVWAETKKGKRFLKPQITSWKYHIVRLYNKEVWDAILVHRLVAAAFISNPENKPEVNHRFGRKTDNRDIMLEWATAKENCNHAYNTGLIVRKKKENAARAILSNSDAIEIIKLLQSGEKHSDISAKFKISRTAVGHIKNGKTTWGELVPEFVCSSDSMTGEGHPMAKLKESQVTEIKKLIGIGTLSSREIGNMFNVNKSTIKDIKSGRKWKGVSPNNPQVAI